MIKIAKKDFGSYAQQTWILVVLALLIGGVMGYVIGGALGSSETSTGQAAPPVKKAYGLQTYPFVGDWYFYTSWDDYCIAFTLSLNGNYQLRVVPDGEYYCEASGVYKVDGQYLFHMNPATSYSPPDSWCSQFQDPEIEDHLTFEYNPASDTLKRVLVPSDIFIRGKCPGE